MSGPVAGRIEYNFKVAKSEFDQARERAAQLREELHRHNYLYYIENQPEISDSEYDRLLRELIQIEESYPDLRAPDSPTQRVGAEPQKGFRKVPHQTPMLSLANAFDEEEMRAFYRRISNILDTEEIDFVTELKIDGVAVRLTYEKGVFTEGATRGNGMIGEEITANLRTIQTVPLRLRGNGIPSVLEVRGEAFLPLSAFDSLNRERVQNGESPFTNPRNAAAGALRQLDPRVTSSRPLAFVAYSVGFLQGKPLKTQWETLEQLRNWGFPTNPESRHHPDFDSVLVSCRQWENDRNTLDYEIDGVVVKVNRFDYQEELGTVSRDPRWAIAFKFPGQVATTRLLKIAINVGRTGALNPYAILEPVQVGGVTIRNATLHNQDDIQRKDIREGDMVVVKRAGDVIPQVVGPVREKRTGEEKIFYYPNHCPECGAPVLHEEGNPLAYCTNKQCPAQRLEALNHFVSRGALDIHGLGPQTLEKMVDLGLVKSPADLYDLDESDVALLPGFQEKSIRNLLESIEHSRRRPLARVLFSLGIRHVGERVAELLADHFTSMERIASASVDEIAEVSGIGPEIAQSIRAFFDNPENQQLVERLVAAGLQMEKEPPETSDESLAGLTFVITGVLPSMSRKEATDLIKAKGGKVTSSVSSNTDFLLVGENPGSKFNKAQSLEIPVLTEEEFLQKIKQKSPTTQDES